MLQPKNIKTDQLPLELIHGESHDLADFVISDCNRNAVALIRSWPDWSSHASALIGPAACGKSHLASVWLELTNGMLVSMGDDLAALPKAGNILLDLSDGGEKLQQDWLFHLFNWSKETNCSLLILSRTPLTKLDVTLPDLASRLATIQAVTMSEPDDMILTAVLIKLFSDKQLQVDLSVIDYILVRMERSFSGVRDLVNALDKMALATKKKISKPLAKNYFETL